jgi:hypothetical protein
LAAFIWTPKPRRQVGGRDALKPWDGESPTRYARRVAREHQTHSPAWKGVDLNDLSGQSLKNAVAQIFADSIAASKSNGIDVDTLREVHRVDSAGHRITEFYGLSKSWMRHFAGGEKRYARLRGRLPRLQPISFFSMGSSGSASTLLSFIGLALRNYFKIK